MLRANEIRQFFDHIQALNKNKLFITEELVQWSINKFNISELEALDLADNKLGKIHLIINKDILNHESRYTIPKYIYSDYDDDILIRSDLLEPEEFKEDIANKIEWWEELKIIIEKLSWRDFELLAKDILMKNGLNNITITKAQSDQGIDFYGYYKLKSDLTSPRISKDLLLRVVGQVKHSSKSNGVSYQKIASFGTEIKKLRKGIGSDYFLSLDNDFLSNPYPIIGIFITNSYYPTKAVNFANEYGIIYWDGIQISQDLSTKEIISEIIDPSGNLSKDKLIELIKK